MGVSILLYGCQNYEVNTHKIIFKAVRHYKTGDLNQSQFNIYILCDITPFSQICII